MSKPRITGASVPRKKSFIIKGDTGEYDAINKGEPKADIVGDVRTVEDNMSRKGGGVRVKTASGRYNPPKKTRNVNTKEPVNKRNAGIHYDPFYRNRVVDLVEEIEAYIERLEED